MTFLLFTLFFYMSSFSISKDIVLYYILHISSKDKKILIIYYYMLFSDVRLSNTQALYILTITGTALNDLII